MSSKNSSAEKRQRQDEKRHLRNKGVKSSIRTAAKKVTTAVEKKDAEAAKAALVAMISEIDSAARKGIVKKNTAARKKSRMQKYVNKLTV